VQVSPDRNRFHVGSIPIDAVTEDDVVRAVDRAVRCDEVATLTYLNAHNFRLAWKDAAYRELLQRFDVVFCDGVGLRLGLRFLGLALPQRMTPPDFVDRLLAGVAAAGEGVFLLGDEPATVAAAGARVEARWPGLVRGHHHGFFGEDGGNAVATAIEASGARLMLVGMGSPLQEQWIVRLAARSGGAWLAVGGLFRWYSGHETRGPRWLTDHGFEWLCRLVVQRRRVARRYLVGLPLFAALLLRLRIFGPAPVRVSG
jgi:N-acetylglucosaminyldiphosphoundecaprenol N-acetyl-beta-D-mannosaminyltransferase